MKTANDFKETLSGPVPSLRVPFTKDGEIDYSGLSTLIDFQINSGAKTILLTQGDSLFSILSDNEIAEITRFAVNHVGKRASVVAATNIWNTKKTVDFAEYCGEIAADILMVLPPDWGASCTIESFTEHYTAASMHLPVMVVTNVFIKRGIVFALKVLEKLKREAPQVMALKDDMGGIFARKASLLLKESWAVIAGGQKQNHMNMHPYGCDGYLSTFLTFIPEISHAYWKAIGNDDLPAASNIIEEFDMPFFDTIQSLPGGFDAGIHGTYELFGLCSRYRRKPYHSLTEGEMDTLKSFFQEKDLL